MKYKTILLLFLVTAFAVLPVTLANRPTYVYDRANILDTTTVNTINNYCGNVDTNTTIEVVVVTLQNLDAYGGDIDTAREKIFNDESLSGVKGIGKAGSDNGVLIVMSVAGPHCGIEVGYGLEGNLTDGRCGRILDDLVMPELKAGNYSGGMINAVIAVAETVAGTSATYSSDSPLDDAETLLVLLLVLIVVIVIVGVLVVGGGGGSGSWSSGGGSFGGGGGGFGGGGSGGGGAGRYLNQRRKQ